jgi:hypothetical protein
MGSNSRNGERGKSYVKAINIYNKNENSDID